MKAKTKVRKPWIQLKYEVWYKLCKCEPSKLGKPESQQNLLKSRNLKYNSNWKHASMQVSGSNQVHRLIVLSDM